MSRILGLDIGDRRIGVALSDPSEILASPLKVIVRSSDESALSEICAFVNKYEAEAVVVGLPYLLDGSVGQQAEKVLAFTREVGQITGARIIMQDERLTSVCADQKLREAGRKKDKLKDKIDAAAASLILQSYLDEAQTKDSSPFLDTQT